MIHQVANILPTRTFETPMLRLSLCDYSDAYIAAKGTVDLLVAA